MYGPHARSLRLRPAGSSIRRLGAGCQPCMLWAASPALAPGARTGRPGCRRTCWPRARAARAQATTLDMVSPALLRRAGQELDRLEPAIWAADGMRPSLVHGDYGTSNVALVRASDGHWQVAAVFDFESAAPGDPVEDLLWTADHGLDSRVFGASTVPAGLHDRGHRITRKVVARLMRLAGTQGVH